MELPSLINKLVTKLAPVSAIENEKINTGCRLWYEKLIEKTKKKQQDGESLNLVDKIVMQLDTWYVQLLFAGSFVFIVSFIQNLMTPDGDDPEAGDLPQ